VHGRRRGSGHPLAEERKHVVRIRIAAEHRLLEDELAVEVNVEDPTSAGHDLDRFELPLPLLENPRRQTGGVRKRPSGDAVLNPNAVPFGHARILADRGLRRLEADRLARVAANSRPGAIFGAYRSSA